jgi:hypothetical protein
MQRLLNYPSMTSSDLEVNPEFNVVICYEDFETGKQAKRTYDYLTQNLGKECQFSSQMWKFEVLEIGKLCEIAAKDAAVADIIIISTHGAHPLPDAVKGWLEISLENTRAIALVVLFSDRSDDPAMIQATTAYLSEQAKRGQMEFFAQPGPLPNVKETEELFAVPRNSVADHRTLSTLASVMHQDFSFPRWGINE